MAGDLPWLMDLDGWLYLAALAPGGVPLALACGRLRRKGYPGVAWMAFGVSGAGDSRGVGLRSPARRVVSRDLCRGGEPAGMVALRAGVPRRACPARAEAEDRAHCAMKMAGPPEVGGHGADSAGWCAAAGRGIVGTRPAARRLQAGGPRGAVGEFIIPCRQKNGAG